MFESLELTTAAHWKGFAHPLRVGIIERLKEREMTNEELAKSLGVQSGKLYFHTKQLLNAGLIERAGTRESGAVTEKLYRAVAKQYVARATAQEGEDGPFSNLVASAAKMYDDCWKEHRDEVERLQLGFAIQVNVPRAALEDARAEIRAIYDRLFSLDSNDAGSQPVAFTVLIHALPRSLFSSEAEK